MYKPIVNFRSGEFYLVCIDKKKVPEKIIKDLILKNPKFEKVTNTSFLLQTTKFVKNANCIFYEFNVILYNITL